MWIGEKLDPGWYGEVFLQVFEGQRIMILQNEFM